MRRSFFLSSGYKFFEDQFPRSTAPPIAYQTYEDQMASAQVTYSPPPPQNLTKEQKVKQLMKWEYDEKGRPRPSQTWGWSDQWGPHPGEAGHNKWYDKSRTYMSYDEKLKDDMGHARPIKTGEIRQHAMELNDRMAASAHSETEKLGKHPDSNQFVTFSRDEQQDVVGTVRQEYMNEWLAQPGVNTNNLGAKIGEYYGTSDKHKTQKVQRRADWDLPAAPDE